MSVSVVLTCVSGLIAYCYIPLTWAMLPIWIVYAVFNGTFVMGCWVIAHECGHRAFSNRNWFQDTVGFTLHSALLTPYFSWQRSHSLHHAKTNHMELGESFVPIPKDSQAGKVRRWWQETVGDEAFAVLMIFQMMLIGWPGYLLTGTSGGPTRGTTNHFWPIKPFSTALFPGKWRRRVWLSDLGVVTMLGILAYWTFAEGSFLPILAVYFGPYLVCNAWLILYTWLQHTDFDVPHFDEDEWTWVKGAFMTVDRPYGKVIDFLHHRIGSTHVAHHIDGRIPHYNAVQATDAIKAAYPDLYRYDPTPIHKAVWRVATHCNVVDRRDEGWMYTGKASR